ncbi:hypothetical protein EVAR_82102_1 [Eumeta japonica]|uniref:Uncharacterized protein n=1 Tax=Eumeta variegata TaxID=151549 RepID=A0A4C1U1R8_EUMVA|nr:hypothetical protein EVAR_82102_1 [Eumeta japonica]
MSGTEEEMREVAARICRNYLHGAWKTVEPNQLDFQRISKEIDGSKAERLDRSCLSVVPRSRSYAQLKRDATSHAFSHCKSSVVDRKMDTAQCAGADPWGSCRLDLCLSVIMKLVPVLDEPQLCDPLPPSLTQMLDSPLAVGFKAFHFRF